MKYIFSFFIILAFISGCTPSSIKLETNKELSSYSMYGKTAGRDFYYPVTVGESISLKWESEINGSFPNSSVTSYNNYIFVNDLSGRVYCFNALNGKVIGALKHDAAVFTTPVIDEYNIIFAAAEDDENKSTLCYYNFSNAKMIYEKEISGRVISEIVKTDKEIFFNTEDGKVYCYNLIGEKIWECDTETKTHSSPALGNGILIFGNDNGELIGINSADGKILYKQKIGESFFGSPSIDGITVYIGNDNGNIYAAELSTGKIKWKFETGARIMMTPVFNDTHIIIGNLRGELYSVNKETGKLNWRTNTRGVLNASPLLTENIIILPDLNEAFHFIDVKTGEKKNTFLLEGRGKLTPVIINDLLYIGYDNGIVRAYEFTN